MKPSCKIFMSINVVKKKKKAMLCGEKENDARPSRAKERDDEKCKQKEKTFSKLQL